MSRNAEVLQQNVPLSNQTMPQPQQNIPASQQPMPQMQYVQYVQMGLVQQYMMGGQAVPQQQYVQQMPRQYYQQQQMPGQPMPQYYQPMPGQQFLGSGGQPMPGGMLSQTPPPFVNLQLQPWTTGLCDCADDLENCIITCFFPCITFGQIADLTDRGMTSKFKVKLCFCLSGTDCTYKMVQMKSLCNGVVHLGSVKE